MYFEPPPEGWNSWRTQIGNVTLNTLTLGAVPPIEGKLRLLVSAETPIEFPDTDKEGFIYLPEDKREQCEQALQIVADLISVCGRCNRSVSSASPCWALIVDDGDERTRLDSTKGVKTKKKMLSEFWFQIPRNDELISGLQDRLSGVAILAEAFSHTRAAGKYREFVRLFEAAFALQFTKLEHILKRFLHPVMGYTRQEIGKWIDFRHPITHADGRKTEQLVFDVDVRKVIQRMEQAAIDVLFSKADWHCKSITRRQLYIPPAITSNSEGSGIIKQGSTPTIKFQIFDEFGVFPLDLNAVITNPPKSWWFKVHYEESVADSDI